jgi:hypothetical protein
MAVRPAISRIPFTLAVLGVLAGSAAADPAAAAVTVGSPLGARANLVTTCRSPAGCTVTAGAARGRPIAIGVDGVIVRWRLRSASRGTAGLRVLRPAPGSGFTTVGAGPRQRLVTRPRAGHDARYTFAARIPVERGDLLAVDVGRGPAAVYRLRGPGYATLTFDPALAGPQARVPTSELDGAELLLNAVVEPDADGDGFGDETQDNCPTIPNDQTTNPCPSTAVPPPEAGDGRPGTAAPSRTSRFRRHKPVPRGGALALR